MALIIPPTAGPQGSGLATYLRFDGLQIHIAPEPLGNGLWGIPADRLIRLRLCAYADMHARSSAAAPVWAAAFQSTVAELVLIEPIPGSAAFAHTRAYRFRTGISSRIFSAV